MRVLICGGRNFSPTVEHHCSLLQVLVKHHMMTYSGEKWVIAADLICGMAKGADLYAYRYWKEFAPEGVTIHEFPAEWDKYGKSAGFKRNTQMLVEGKPDLVIAFPGGKGTAMMVDIARKAGVPVEEIT